MGFLRNFFHGLHFLYPNLYPGTSGRKHERCPNSSISTSDWREWNGNNMESVLEVENSSFNLKLYWVQNGYRLGTNLKKGLIGSLKWWTSVAFSDVLDVGGS